MQKTLLAVLFFPTLFLALNYSAAGRTPGNPVITSFSPGSGAPGTVVTILGSNLNSPLSFTIGGVQAIIISNDGSTLVGMVMPGASTGLISVTTGAGSTSGASNFLVTATPYPSIQIAGPLTGSASISGNGRRGYAVAVSADGNTAVMGIPGDDLSGGQALGGIFIYVRSGNVWNQQGGKLVGSGGNQSEQGSSVAISADGNTVIEGGFNDNITGPGSVGAAWIFNRVGTTWTQQSAKLVGTGSGATSDQGHSVTISADGNTAAVGGDGDNGNIGAVWVYVRSGGSWSQSGNKIVPTGSIGLATLMGWSVALSADASTLLIGGVDDNGNAGAGYIFILSGGVYVQQAKLINSTATGATSLMGFSVALSANGNTAILGGNGDNTSVGSAWVFVRSGTSWNEQAKLVGSGASGAAFEGSSVSISADGNTALVGGYGDNTEIGATWIFTRAGTAWGQQGSKFIASGGSGPKERQGNSVSLAPNGATAIIGGPYNNTFYGAAWILAAVPSCSPSTSAVIANSGVSTICNGSSANIKVTITGGVSPYMVVYSNGSTNTTVSNYTSGSNIIVSPSSTTSYTLVSVTEAGGCAGSGNSGTATVNVNPIPATATITPGGPTTFCSGGSVTLSSSAASGNQWYLNNGPISGATAQNYVANATGDYSVVVTSLSCSSSPSAATSVTVNPIPATPTINASGPTTFCSGGTVTLTSSAASGNQWYLNNGLISGATGQNYVVNATGNYTVVVTSLGCSSSPSLATSVTVNPIPATPTINALGPTTFCSGGSVTLSSSAASGNQWYLNNGLIAGATGQNYVVNATGNYTVVVTSLNCSSSPSAATSVTVNPIPATPTITAGGPTTFCSGGTVTLTSSAASGNQWYLNNGLISGATGQNYVVNATGNYTVVVTSLGCSSSPSLATSVTVNPIPATPTINALGPTTFCSGGSVTLSSSAASGNQWYLNNGLIAGATGQNYLVNATGNYTVVVTSLNCSSSPSAATSVTVNPIPATPTITAGGPTTFCSGGTVTLTSSAASGNQWYLNTGLITGATGQSYVASANGNYIVVVTSSGCSSAASAGTSVTVNPPPTINCPSNINKSSDPGQCGAIVSYTATTTGTPTPTITYSPASGSFFPVGSSTVTVTATNSCGTATCTFTVIVAPPLVNIPPSYAVAAPGGAANTIYKTYGPQTLNLTANVAGAVSPTYNWSGPSISGSSTGQTITVAPATPGDYTYSVIVNANGCQANGSTVVHVVNISSSGSGNKVSLCQTSTNTTITIGPGWVPSYLANGYTLGACSTPVVTIVGDTSSAILTPDMGSNGLNGTDINTLKVMVSPNPSAGEFKVKIASASLMPIEVRILDNAGRTVEVNESVIPGSTIGLGSYLRTGTYFLEVRQGVDKKTVKVVKMD